MEYTDFIKKQNPLDETEAETPEVEIVADENIDVQKAVVEELAAEKVEMESKLDELKKKIFELEQANKKLEDEKQVLKSTINDDALTKAENAKLKKENASLSAALLSNTETNTSSQIALLDRNLELPDRFPGETREQVIAAIKVALDEARENGRIRRAQLLESVLVVNESTGEIEKKREAMEKFFNEHQNILDGEVIAKLTELGIPYKNGEEYLLTSEIVKRTY